MLVVAAPTLILVISNTPLYESLAGNIFPLLWAALILPPVLALVTLIYLLAAATTARDQTVPDAS